LDYIVWFRVRPANGLLWQLKHTHRRLNGQNQPEWFYSWNGFHDLTRTIQEKHVNREKHPQGMNAVAWRDPQTLEERRAKSEELGALCPLPSALCSLLSASQQPDEPLQKAVGHPHTGGQASPFGYIISHHIPISD
jgi:hypothetical protein